MSKLFAGLSSEKPHSSISDWVEILSSDRYKENELDGIPELVEAINLQRVEGVGEATRAIRKKLKYGDTHRQLRALTILKALVENAGVKFQTTFANEPLTTRIKAMATDPLTDEKVKRKLMSILAGWHRSFKDDPKMTVVANLWESCGGGKPARPKSYQQPKVDYEAEAAKRKADAARAKEAERLREEERKRREREKYPKNKKDMKDVKPKGKPFNFEQEKPAIITSIANASQAATQLLNALKLVNREKESIENNEKVKECLADAKAARKTVIRYIQRVENEDIIGTLLDANERIIVSLQLYDKMLKSADHDSDEEDVAAKLKALALEEGNGQSGEISKLQGKQRARIERASSRSSLNVNSGGVSRPAPPRAGNLHPDLRDLNWADSDGSRLPPPLRPRSADEEASYRQGSLSDYSDYDSSEEGHPSTSRAGNSHVASSSRNYNSLIGDEDELVTGGDARQGLLAPPDDDPFADPFADSRSDLGTPALEKKRAEAEL